MKGKLSKLMRKFDNGLDVRAGQDVKELLINMAFGAVLAAEFTYFANRAGYARGARDVIEGTIDKYIKTEE